MKPALKNNLILQYITCQHESHISIKHQMQKR